MPPKLIELDKDKCLGLFHSWANEEYHANVCTGTNSVVLLKLFDMMNDNMNNGISYVSLDGNTNVNCVPHGM